MPALLAHSIVREPPEPEAYLLVLHGIMGSGANWRGLMRRLVSAHPRLGAVLVDLRLHGGSRAASPPHTLASAAADLSPLIASLPAPVTGIVGHSFGGKVALCHLAQDRGAIASAWVIDAAPGPRPDAHGSESTLEVLAMLERLGTSFASRAEFAARVEAEGHPAPFAQWLGMNLERDGERVRLALDLGGVRSLLGDYFARDLWQVVEDPPEGVTLHMVIGGRSSVVDEADRARLSRAEQRLGGRLRVHLLPRAGHWVHVDDPDGLFAVMDRSM